MSAVDDALDFINDLLRNTLWWIIPSGRDERKADNQIRGLVPEEHQPSEAEEAAEKDLRLINDKEQRKLARDVVNIMLKGRKLTNHNEAIIKLYIKNYFNLDFITTYRVTRKGEDVKGFIEGYRKAAEMIEFDKKRLSKFLSDYNKRVKKIRELSEKKEEKKLEKLVSEAKKDWQEVIKDLITNVKVESRVYDKQVADLEELKERLGKMDAGPLKNNAELLINNKKEALKRVKKEKGKLEELKEKIGKMELEGLEELVDECFKHHYQAVVPETKATKYGVIIMEAFLEAGWFKRLMLRTSKHLTKDHMKFYKDYNEYVKKLADSLNNKREEIRAKEEELSKPREVDASEEGMTSITTCINCQAQISGDANYCPSCGKKVKGVKSGGYLAGKESTYWTVVCPHCKYRVRTKQGFTICQMCGKRIK